MSKRDGGCGCKDCTAGGTCGGHPVSRHNATTGRFTVERGGELPGEFHRSFDRNYEVQAYTGYPTSSVPAGRWNRGILYRRAQPVLHLSSPGPMFDPSDPRTWPRRVG